MPVTDSFAVPHNPGGFPQAATERSATNPWLPHNEGTAKDRLGPVLETSWANSRLPSGSERGIEMFVDQRSAGVPRRDGGLEKMVPIADSGNAAESNLRFEEFARELSLDDPVFAAELFSASGGSLSLGKTAVEAASLADFVVDLESTSFADYVAARSPTLSLGISDCDERAAAVLAHLSPFTNQTALLALSALLSGGDGGISAQDPDGILLRLRMSGVLVPDGGSGRARLLKIPMLIAAKLRHSLAADPESAEVVLELVSVLVTHLEEAASPDVGVLADALVLTRRAGLWSELSRIRDAGGLPIFLLTPQAACIAFGHLPSGARNADPGLGFFAALAEDVMDEVADDPSPERIRSAVITETGPGRMRLRLPGFGEMSQGGYIETLRRMIGLQGEGHHGAAAALGLAESTAIRPTRAHLVIRLLTAISLFHAAQPRRAISILHDIESSAETTHIDGDFLLPAAYAWTALIAAVSGDHERADQHLAWLIDEKSSPVMIDELVHPAQSIAAALRALDRLDLDRAREECDNLAAYPENRSLDVYPSVIGRTLAILSATAESGLLFANDDVENFSDAEVVSPAGRDLLAASRSMVFICLGQLKWAELELERISPGADSHIVLSIRGKLVAGRYEDAIASADNWFYHRSLTPKSRAELAAIRAAALLRTGDEAAASAEFITAVGLSTWVSSLLPLAFIPQKDRNRLIDLTEDAHAWREAAVAFSGHFRSTEDLISRLRTISAVAVGEASMPQLSANETQLLNLLSRGLSIAEISVELDQATGTVKNRLSVMYRKFEVSNRAETIARAKSLGFLSAH